MQDVVQFETPENITVSYRLAGPGTRFIACVFDFFVIAAIYIALIFLLIALVSLLLAAGLGAGPTGITAAFLVSAGIVIAGFLTIGYFAAFEWFLNGQTLGARLMLVRAVTEEGFALSLTAVLIRNIFRIIDTFPIFWLVPLVSKKGQRFGDMVAGTIVVREDVPWLSALRERLAARPPADAWFAFSAAQLGKARPVDLHAAESFLDRCTRIHPEHRALLARRFSEGIARQLEVTAPDTPEEQERFLEDLLAGHARREARELG